MKGFWMVAFSSEMQNLSFNPNCIAMLRLMWAGAVTVLMFEICSSVQAVRKDSAAKGFVKELSDLSLADVPLMRSRAWQTRMVDDVAQ